jgi:hypothetical protein
MNRWYVNVYVREEVKEVKGKQNGKRDKIQDV